MGVSGASSVSVRDSGVWEREAEPSAGRFDCGWLRCVALSDSGVSFPDCPGLSVTVASRVFF